jgi:membrane protease YdiL (CAAX protease family)
VPEGAVVERPSAGNAGGASLPAFFVLTFAGSWACFLAAGALARRAPAGDAPGPAAVALVTLGVFVPAMVAIALTARAAGGRGVRALLGPMFRWQVRPGDWAFALLFMMAIKLTAAVVHRALFGAWPVFGAAPWYLMLVATVFTFFGQVGEEPGWRGFALPRLASRWGVGPASVLLGVIWAAWHLPLFRLSGADTAGQSFPLYLVQVTALSVAFGWLWWRTGGSLLLTMLFHSAVNNTKDIVPSHDPGATAMFALSRSRVAWITVVLLWVAAAFFLTRLRGARGARAG